MTQSPYPVGYGRPPEHTRFQKGQSGNPSGKPGPRKRLKRDFDVALDDALNANRWELRDAKPAKAIEALARKVVLDALDGRSSAQRLVLAVLDREDCGEVDGERREVEQGAADEKGTDEDEGSANEDGSDDDADEEETTDEDRFVFEGNGISRELFGNRYDEFKARLEAAVNSGSLDDIAALADEFDFPDKFPAAGNSAGNI